MSLLVPRHKEYVWVLPERPDYPKTPVDILAVKLRVATACLWSMIVTVPLSDYINSGLFSRGEKNRMEAKRLTGFFK